MQRCICGSSARFSNARLLLPQQCYFFKSNAVFTQAVLLFEIPSTAFAAAALLFQIQRCICRSSANFSNPRLLLPQQCCSFRFNTAFAEFNTANSPAALLLQIQPCGRLTG